MDQPQSQSGHFGEEISLPCPESNQNSSEIQHTVYSSDVLVIHHLFCHPSNIYKLHADRVAIFSRHI
jgi:hypothetical protein